MKWTSVDKELPKPAKDILFTDGKEIYKGWLETHTFGEDLLFCNDQSGIFSENWPENVTHWMPLPKPPAKQ